MKRTFLLYLAAILAPVGAIAEIRADRADGTQKFDSGLFYTLPRTAIRVAAPVIKNVYKPGIYCKVASTFFALAPASPTCSSPPEPPVVKKCKGTSVDPSGFVKDACIDFTFTDTPTLSMIGTPDPSQVYHLDLSGWGKEKDFTLSLSQDSIVNKVHAQVVDRRGEIIFGFLNAAASIAKGAFALAMKAGETTPTSPCGDKDPICKAAMADFDTLKSLVADNSAFSAQTNFPTNSDAYLAFVKARQERINDLLSKFFGTAQSKPDYDGAVEVIPVTQPPDKALGIEAVLFGLGMDGACDAQQTNSMATIRFLSAAPSTRCKDAKLVKLTLDTRVATGDTSVSRKVADSIKTDNNNNKDHGLAYRIPAPYAAKLFLDKEEQTEQDVSIAQLGFVAHLPEKLGGDATVDFTLDSATGALLQVSLNGKPKILTDLPGQLSTLGGGALDVLSAYQKAHPDAAAPDPLNQATSARKLAQEQLRLLLIQQCVAQPDRPECPTLVTQP